MCRIAEGDFQKILESIKIEDVIGEYVSLTKKGVNYIGLCPFHNEKTASFVVSPSKGVCKCFGCQEGGDAIWFVKNYKQDHSMTAAAKRIAARWHISITEITEPEQQLANDRSQVYAANKLMANYFRDQLLADREVKAHLIRKRGIQTLEELDHWNLGYSPDSWVDDNESLQMLFNTYTTPQLQEWGLVNKNGGPFFRNRIMFPIKNLVGYITGFGGRDYSGQSTIKYLNTPDTIVFNKSEELYGMLQCKSSIKEFREVILTEGYYDVISTHRQGEATVASCGTALTEQQAKAIARFAKSVYIMYDPDTAGQKATVRAIPVLWKEGLRANVLLSDPSLGDPDDIYRNTDVEIARSKFKQHSAIEFLKDSLEGDEEEKIEKILEMIVHCPLPLRRESLLKEVGKLFQFSIDSLIAKTNQIQAKRWGQYKPTT